MEERNDGPLAAFKRPHKPGAWENLKEVKPEMLTQ